ncbi:MAG: NYN domain-containing protein, partial [Solirubrobacterales bacterium]
MSNRADTKNMALFCDFENIALGVRDANYAQFDIGKVLERLLLKGNIVVKKAYCDWERYKEFKPAMHEASFEMIEIPHVRLSGKNSADIRMVVDALDLCYTKEHLDTFVILSGDSDFSPLVSKLRENDKIVIGVGVKNSTSELLIANCDEFIYYDDLVRRPPARRREPSKEQQQQQSRRQTKGQAPKAAKPGEDKKQEAWDLIVQT